MTWVNRLSPEAKAEVRQARKAQAQDDKKRKLERAREVLKATESKFRQPRKRDAAFLNWLRRAPCLVCAIRGTAQVDRTEAAHVRRAYPEPGWRPVGGAEKPSDVRALPQCRACHVEQHQHDNHGFYSDLGIYPPTVCAELKAAQEAGADPVETVETVAAAIRSGQ